MEKIVIIGDGPAGISAALYAARGNMEPLVISMGSSALDKAELIQNYYGLSKSMTGKELHETGISQARELGVRFMEAQVLGVSGFDTFEIKTTAGDLEAECVILATGSQRKTPGIQGLKELEGRGVSYCAVCDAFFYRGKEVAVLGNGEFALHEAEELAPMASKVTICTNGSAPDFSGEAKFPVNTAKIQKIQGDDQVTGICFSPEVSAMDTELQAVHPLQGRWGQSLQKRAIYRSMKIWKVPFPDFLRQEIVQADFFRWQRLFMKARRQDFLRYSMCAQEPGINNRSTGKDQKSAGSSEKIRFTVSQKQTIRRNALW